MQSKNQQCRVEQFTPEDLGRMEGKDGVADLARELREAGGSPALCEYLEKNAELSRALREAGAENLPDTVALLNKAPDGLVRMAAKAAGMSDLTAAVMLGRTDEVKALIEQGADVNEPDRKGALPLFVAAGAGHADVARALVGGGANVEAKNERGQTALMVAAGKGHAAVARGSLTRARTRRRRTMTA